MFQIALSPSGELELYLPTGRSIEIPATPSGLSYIQKVLSDYHRGLHKQSGYVKSFPTQHNVDKWLKENKVKVEEERKEIAKSKYNVDLDKLEIRL